MKLVRMKLMTIITEVDKEDKFIEVLKGFSIEDFVERIISVCPEEYATIFERFYDRYLNFDKLKNKV